MEQQTAELSPAIISTDTDIFAWANNLFEFKEDLKIELFLIGKNSVLYRAKLHADLIKQLQLLFVDGLLEYVLDGVDTGLAVRGFEEAESEENVLQRTKVARVDNLVEVLNWLKTQEHEIELFEEDHDLKRIRGVVARCSHPRMKQTFYVIKQLPRAQVLKGDGAWMLQGSSFVPIIAGVLRIPTDNQLLVIDHDIYVFNQAKLESLFGYNAKKASIAEKKVRAIEANFKLKFVDELDLQTMVKGNKATINKLQKVNPASIKQEDLLDHAEELNLGLMTDEENAIIIMNQKDLTTFVNLLNDDYVESNLTGIRYEIKSKRPLKVAETAQESREA
jgi:hypothetical protein